MSDPNPHHDQAPDDILAGALAHLAQHMASGCQRSAYLAAMLLDQIAIDPRANRHLRQHARQLAEILEGEPAHVQFPQIGPAVRNPVTSCHSLAGKGVR